MLMESCPRANLCNSFCYSTFVSALFVYKSADSHCLLAEFMAYLLLLPIDLLFIDGLLQIGVLLVVGKNLLNFANWRVSNGLSLFLAIYYFGRMFTCPFNWAFSVPTFDVVFACKYSMVTSPFLILT